MPNIITFMCWIFSPSSSESFMARRCKFWLSGGALLRPKDGGHQWKNVLWVCLKIGCIPPILVSFTEKFSHQQWILATQFLDTPMFGYPLLWQKYGVS